MNTTIKHFFMSTLCHWKQFSWFLFTFNSFLIFFLPLCLLFQSHWNISALIERNYIYFYFHCFSYGQKKGKSCLFMVTREEKRWFIQKDIGPVELSSTAEDKKWTHQMKEKRENGQLFSSNFGGAWAAKKRRRKSNSHINLFEVIFNAIVEKSIFHHHQSLLPPTQSSLTKQAAAKSRRRKYKFFTGTSPKVSPPSSPYIHAHTHFSILHQSHTHDD